MEMSLAVKHCVSLLSAWSVCANATVVLIVLWYVKGVSVIGVVLVIMRLIRRIHVVIIDMKGTH